MPPQPLPPPNTTAGTLRIPREIAAVLVPWMDKTARELVPPLGKESSLSRFINTAVTRLAAMGGADFIQFNMPYGFLATLADFNRRECRDPLLRDQFFYVLGNGWKAGKAEGWKAPADELERAKRDLATPYVETPFVPVEKPAEVKAKGSLF